MTHAVGDAGRMVFYDDRCARGFEPFATSRPLSEMRAGAMLVRERWEVALGGTSAGFVSAAHLAGFAEFDAPPAVEPRDVGAGVIVVNSRALPVTRERAGTMQADGAEVWTLGGRVAAVRLAAALAPAARDALARGALALDDLVTAGARERTLDGVWLDEVWDIIRHLNVLLAADIPLLAAVHACRAVSTADAGVTVVGAHPVFAEDGANIEPHVVFDTGLGPVLLRRGATVQAFTRVVGPCYVGRDSTIMGDRISGSAIGDTCRVHGELSASVFIGHSNKGHDGFVGHSIVGRWVNMGAGTITSNLKNTYGTVALWTPAGVQDTGLQFLGTLFGDHAKTGIGLRLTTGCVLGAGANVMDQMPPKYVAPFSWGTAAPYAAYALDKFLETATRMMSRRSVAFDEAQSRFWCAVHARATRAHDDVAGHGPR